MSAVRLAAQLCAVFTLALLVAGLWLGTQLQRDARDVVDDFLVDDHLSYTEEFADAGELVAWFEEARAESTYLFAGFQSAEGAIYGDFLPEAFATEGYTSLPAQDILTPRARAALRAGALDDEPFEDDPLDDEMTWRLYVAPFDGGVLAVAETVEQVEGVLALLPSLLALIGLPVIALTLGAGLLLGWQQQRRLDRIRAGIGRIAEGHFDAPLAPARPRDDLDDVMVGVDRAAEKLRGSFDRLTHFTQSVAHELRTPLTRLRAGLEPHADDPVAALALDQTDEVIRVFTAVQRIARLSGRSGRATGAPVQLAEVVRLMDDLFADVAEENGQRLEVALDAPATVPGDQQLIAQLVSNLVENALRHAGPGACIRLSATGARLTVSDTGKGLPDALRDKMFDAFARGGDGEGMGLGLSLVQAIADYHGATISLGAQDQPGFALTVDFGTPA